MKKACCLVAVVFLLTGTAVADGPAFYPVDLYVNSGDRPLAAYQVEFLYDSEAISLVGVEGGEAPFHRTPYYDPAGFTSDRIVVASFTNELKPPGGRVHVGTMHLLRKGNAEGKPVARLVLAAGPDGRKHDAALEVLIKGGGSTR